jgi:hypothetical protein
MMYVSDNNPERKNGKSLREQTSRGGIQLFVHEFSTGQIKDMLQPGTVISSPLQELIAIAEATFELARLSKMDQSTKNVLNQLEKQFQFYRRLLELRCRDFG